MLTLPKRPIGRSVFDFRPQPRFTNLLKLVVKALSIPYQFRIMIKLIKTFKRASDLKIKLARQKLLPPKISFSSR